MVRQNMNRDQLHDQNLKFVLQQIFNNRPTSRIEISHQLDLNKSTVSSLYSTLMADGYLHELGLGEAATTGGRRPTLVEINRHYGYTLTFDLGYRHLHASANLLDGTVWEYDRIDTLGQSIHEMVALVKAYADEKAQHHQTAHGLLGICFSIHGIVWENQIIRSPFIDMEDVDLVTTFEALYHVPVQLENEANLSAIYERDFNGAREMNSMVTLSIHRGIGAGIVLKKDLFRGEHGKAGEVGPSIVNVATAADGSLVMTHAEERASEDAIIAQVEAQKDLTGLTREDVVALFLQGDADVDAILNQFCAVIAGVIFNVVGFYDPDGIFINSPMVEMAPELLTRIRAIYHTMARNPLAIKLTPNARLATVLGGCSLITHVVLGLTGFDLNFERPAVSDTTSASKENG